MNMPLVLLNRRRRGNVFTPSGLFALAEPGVWYDPSDLTTLFTDTAGTQPVTTPGQTVALALDKSKGLVLGPELVTNGDFSSGSTGWTSSSGFASTAAIVSGEFQVTATVAYGRQIQAITCVVGRTYRVTCTARVVSGSVTALIERTSSTGSGVGFGPFAGTASTSNTTLSMVFTASGTTEYISVGSGSTGTGQVMAFDNISVRELPGFHATQATAASRPTYGIVPRTGRRNLLTYSEDLTNAAWVVDASGVTKTATRIAETATTTAHYIRQAAPATLTGSIAFSCEVKADGRRYAWLYAATSSAALIYYDLQLGTVASVVGSGVTGSISAVGDGYYRISIFVNLGSLVGNVGVGLTDTNGVISYAGDTSKGLFVRNAQLETGSSATAYQRVGSAFDVTEAGVASLSYLFFGGEGPPNDARWLVTPTITPGIDKAQVFAGVRKLSDAAPGTVAELSADSVSSSGSFGVFAPGSITGAIDDFGALLKGSALTGGRFNGYDAPTTRVISSLFDISQATAATEITFRANGSTVPSDGIGGLAANAGTGNFLAYPLYIGRRGGTTVGFNGQIFSLIVRFGTNLDAGTITSTETWVAGKTGVTL